MQADSSWGQARRAAAAWAGVRPRKTLLTLLAGTAALVIFMALPVRASAHALLVSAQPSDGARLGLAPGAVVLDFSEGLNPTLSQATVDDPGGQQVTAHPVAVQEIRVDLLTNRPGVYRVAWVAVSGDDGHTTEGALSFTVGSDGAADIGNGRGGPSSGDLAISAGRWVEDAALLLAIGMLLIRSLAAGDPALSWVRPRLRPVVIVACIAGGYVICGEALVASGGQVGRLAAYFGTVPAGAARIARVLLEANAAIAVFTRVRRLGPAVVAPVIALAASGHAVQNLAQLGGIVLDAVHLVAAGSWVGGVVAMATLRPPHGWRSDGRPLLRRFTPWALGAFALTVGTGALQAILALGSLGAFTATWYGAALLSKIGLVGLMLPLSLIAWGLRRPRMRAEAGIGVAVIAAAALLASLPVPARGSNGSAVPGTAAAAVGLPQGSQFTLGGHAGEVLVGVTVDPPHAGSNEVTVYVLPPRGASAAALLNVTARLDAAPLPLTVCGDPCRHAPATLHGGDRLEVSVAAVGGGTAQFVIPSLPAADGSPMLSAALARMRALHSYAMHEVLTSGGTVTVLSDYRAVAPDRLQWTGDNGASNISVGTRRYSRDSRDSEWTEQAGPVIPEPAFVWESFTPYTGVHLIGPQLLGDTATSEVAFFGGGAATPVWFRLWIDGRGLVVRAEMRAPGHYMDQTYGEFDAAFDVRAPAVVAPSPASSS